MPMGAVMIKLDKYKESLNYLNRSIKSDAKIHSAYYFKSFALNHLNKCTEALQSINKAIKLNSTTASYYRQKMICLSSLGQVDEAKKLYKKGFKLDELFFPKWPLILEELTKPSNYKSI